MSKTIHIRNVLDELHSTLKARATAARMSLSDYLLEELRNIADQPTLDELRERLHSREPVTVPLDAARVVREERGF